MTYIYIAIPAFIGISVLVGIGMSQLFKPSHISLPKTPSKTLKKVDEVSLDKNKSVLLSAGLFLSILLAVLVIESFTISKKFPDPPLNTEGLEDEILNIPITQQLPPPPPEKVKAPEIVEVEEEPEEEPEVELDPEEEEPIEEEYNEEAFEEEEEVVESILNPGEIAKNPEFPGGFGAFNEYVRANFVISSRDYAEENKGTVYLRFVVEKNGAPSQITVVRGVSDGIDKEAIRVLKKSPKWHPGVGYNGAPARVWYTVPMKIRF